MEVNSPSSSGKTWIIEKALDAEDPSGYYSLTGMSERALIYGEDSLSHRIVFIGEPEGLGYDGMGAAVLKSLTWEGHIRYDTVVTDEGRPKGIHIEREGPTGLIVATTKPLEEQLSNRLGSALKLLTYNQRLSYAPHNHPAESGYALVQTH